MFREIGKRLTPYFDADIEMEATVNGLSFAVTVQDLIKYVHEMHGMEADWLDPAKGLFIRGNVGTGKTLLMQALQLYAQLVKLNYFHIATAREIKRAFSIGGFASVDKYGYNTTTNGHAAQSKPWTYCIDDLGTEGTDSRHFGESTNVLAEIIQDRYELFTRQGRLTHFTTNMTPTDLEQFYGVRIKSRLREMCNDIVLKGKDRRK